MENAATVITDALQLLLVQASEAEIEADEARSAIRFLNRLMDRLAARGYNFGYTEVTNLGDDITIPDGAVEPVIFNLAVALAPLYLEPGEQIHPDVRTTARDGMRTLARIAVNIRETAYPCTLPYGSGNTGRTTRTENFYPCTTEQIVDEVNQNIAVEDNTVESIENGS